MTGQRETYVHRSTTAASSQFSSTSGFDSEVSYSRKSSFVTGSERRSSSTFNSNLAISGSGKKPIFLKKITGLNLERKTILLLLIV